MSTPQIEYSSLSVKRCHGLGNVIMLLPVLTTLIEKGVRVHLVTQPQWVDTFQKLCPKLTVSDQCRPGTLDLDLATESLRPQSHRSKEFAEALNIDAAVTFSHLQIRREWSEPFSQWKGAIGFAPEAGHNSRRWPVEYSRDLASILKGSPLILLGTTFSPSIPNDLDTRGQLNLQELLGLLKVLRLLICMDSGMLHLGAAIGIPTIAIFGGIDPRFRILEDQRVVALQADMDCCPCNKQETCGESYDCIKAITPQAVLDVVEICLSTTTRVIHRI